jgi:6-phosphofructokinase 1
MPSKIDLRGGRTWPEPSKLLVPSLGPCIFPSPIPHNRPFTSDTDRVLLGSSLADLEPFLAAGQKPPSFEPAGPRERIFFDPSALGCGIVTCGGLCPGLNNVIRAIVLTLTYAYGVKRILGFRYGYSGLGARASYQPLALTPDVVDTLHEQGGTWLGTSRGPQDVGEMIDTLVRRDIGVLFVLGGDGGLRGGSALSREIARRGLKIGVIGVPKTIDNDLTWTWRSFGFLTAVEAAHGMIQAAHTEARAAFNGVGLVKLMGRHSGFIAAHATLASSDVNFCLIPEVPLDLEGERGFLQALERRLAAKPHAVVVVAEGTGQELVQDPGGPQRDASGNVRLKDIGVFLRGAISEYFAGRGKEIPIRYIDPSYAIRSSPANSSDAQFCLALGQHAVHAGMAGRTNMVVGWWNNRYINLPIPLAVGERRRLDPAGEDWQRVLETTGQSALMG